MVSLTATIAAPLARMTDLVATLTASEKQCDHSV